MSDNRPYPPSENRLRTLRLRGVIPITSDVVHFGAILGLYLGAFLGFPRFVSQLQMRVAELFQSAFHPGLSAPAEIGPSVYLGVRRVLGEALVLGIGSVVCGVVVISLVQTRFFFRMPFVLSRRERDTVTARCSRVFVALLWISCAGVLLSVSIYPFESLVSRAGGGEQTDLQRIAGWGEQWSSLSQTVAGLAVLFSAIIGGFSYLCVWVAFRKRYGMSRAELEAEIRETEVHPDVRRAVAEFSHER